jgi:MoaA/NifB/PqqE/SkfB family radical SAM enzyme
MELSSLHLLLTYQCTLECAHCFVWGSPWQQGTMTLDDIEYLLEQAHSLGGIDTIYFEGGEPFLYYPILVAGVRQAAKEGFKVGIVSNGYWATSLSDAVEWLRPFEGLLSGLSISSDLYHWSETFSQQARAATEAAEQLNLPVGVITVDQPESESAQESHGQLSSGESGVMYRGRAVRELAGKAVKHPWEEFTACPHEDLRDPGRVHVDPLGNVHLCQGLLLGNVYDTPLKVLYEDFIPEQHPIVGPLMSGGPAELVRHFGLPHEPTYVDACHLCDSCRRLLRQQFQGYLGPDQMYGVPGE